MKIIKSEKYIKMGLQNKDPLRYNFFRGLEERIAKLKPTFIGKEKQQVEPDFGHMYSGRVDDNNYIANQFMQSFFNEYNEKGQILPEAFEKLSRGEYDDSLEQAWHSSAENEYYYKNVHDRENY